MTKVNCLLCLFVCLASRWRDWHDAGRRRSGHCHSVTSRSHDDIKHSKYNVLSCYDVDTVTLLHHDLMMTSNTVSTILCLVMMWWSGHCDSVTSRSHDDIKHSKYNTLSCYDVMKWTLWLCYITISWWHQTQ